ncbi:hypothetical protein FXO38_22481 [Capsicum annuum]|nr:hypothetical protein FXO38_22481 [Capsicum annuum]KAF3654470.1 hypothetical protein FXO37_16458 [Capsicum annuum]
MKRDVANFIAKYMVCQQVNAKHLRPGGETRFFDPDLVHQAIEKVNVIRERLKNAQSRQKFYVDMRQRDLEFEIVRRVGNLAYKLDLPTMLVEDVSAMNSLSYEKFSIEILNRQVRRLRNKDVASMKVLRRNQKVEATTWEAKEDMKLRKQNSHLKHFPRIG